MFSPLTLPELCDKNISPQMRHNSLNWVCGFFFLLCFSKKQTLNERA